MLELLLVGYLIYNIHYTKIDEISHQYKYGVTLNPFSIGSLGQLILTPEKFINTENLDVTYLSGSFSYYDYDSMWEYTLPYLAQYQKSFYGNPSLYNGYVDFEAKRYFNNGLNGFYISGFLTAGIYQKLVQNATNFQKNKFLGIGFGTGYSFQMGEEGRYYGWFGLKYGIHLYQEYSKVSEYNYTSYSPFFFDGNHHYITQDIFNDLELFRFGMKF